MSRGAEGATCGTGSAARSRYVRRTGLRLAHRPLLANFFDTLLGRSSTGATSVNAAPGVRRIAVSLPRPASTRSRSTGLRAHLHEGADPAMVGRGQALCRRPRVASEATTTLAPGQVPPLRLRLRLRLLRGRGSQCRQDGRTRRSSVRSTGVPSTGAGSSAVGWIPPAAILSSVARPSGPTVPNTV